MLLISWGAAFAAGLASFLSPCMLPLVPIYLTQLVGRTASHSSLEQNRDDRRWESFLHTLMFVLGFTLVFVSLGATASSLGFLLRSYQTQLRQIGGIVLVIIGLQLIGILKLPFLSFLRKGTFLPSRPSYIASIMIGCAFAIGWTPCISLLLSSILVLAANATTLREGVILLLLYSLGMGLPFLVLGLGINQARQFFKWFEPQGRNLEIAAGVVIIVVGVAIYLNMLVYLNSSFVFGAKF